MERSLLSTQPAHAPLPRRCRSADDRTPACCAGHRRWTRLAGRRRRRLPAAASGARSRRAASPSVPPGQSEQREEQRGWEAGVGGGGFSLSVLAASPRRGAPARRRRSRAALQRVEACADQPARSLLDDASISDRSCRRRCCSIWRCRKPAPACRTPHTASPVLCFQSVAPSRHNTKRCVGGHRR